MTLKDKFLKFIFIISGIIFVFYLGGCGSDDEVVLDKTTIQLTALDSFETGDRSHSVVKDGNYVYVANREQGLLVFDVSGNSFTQISTLDFNQGESENAEAFSLTKSGNYIYIAAREGGLLTVDVSSPEQPVLSSVYNPDESTDAYDLSVVGNNVFLAYDNNFLVFDISNPGQPELAGSWQSYNLELHHFIVSGDFAFLAYNMTIFTTVVSGFDILNIADPAQPIFMGSIESKEPIASFVKNGDFLITGLYGAGLAVYNSLLYEDFEIASLSTSSLVNPSYDDQTGFQIVRRDPYVYIADGNNGITVVNIRDVTKPYLVERVETGGEVTGIFVDDDILVVADETTGIHLFQINEVSDRDSDGFPDDEDFVPDDPLENQDTDGDGIGNNADTDDDGDGVLDDDDAFPLNPSESADSDNDGIGDNADPFPDTPDDTDNDGVTNDEDLDDDGDGRTDITDDYPLDTDNDGIDNAVDTDDDNDGVLDTVDAFPLDEEEWEDLNGDEIGDNFPNNRFAVIVTNMGTIKLELLEDLAPITSKNFIRLAQDGYFDGITFHRVIDDFMIQGGDPSGDGTGGPGYAIIDEFPKDGNDELLLTHDSAGVLSMANAGANTGGSQFFITLVPTGGLDGVHSIFGRVMEGLEVVQAIGDVETGLNEVTGRFDKPLTDVVMESVTITTE